MTRPCRQLPTCALYMLHAAKGVVLLKCKYGKIPPKFSQFPLSPKWWRHDVATCRMDFCLEVYSRTGFVQFIYCTVGTSYPTRESFIKHIPVIFNKIFSWINMMKEVSHPNSQISHQICWTGQVGHFFRHGDEKCLRVCPPLSVCLPTPSIIIVMMDCQTVSGNDDVQNTPHPRGPAKCRWG